MMARNMSEPVKTFSVGFVEDGDRSELADARQVASAFGADHHELELSMSDTHDEPRGSGLGAGRAAGRPLGARVQDAQRARRRST